MTWYTTSVDVLDLADRLEAWAAGYYPSEAAVALLIAHGTWLHRIEFSRQCIDNFDGYDRNGNTIPMASLDWNHAADLAGECLSTETQILGIACELAGHPIATPLGHLISGLDVRNVGLVLDAIAHLAGWHERPCSQVVTGWPGDNDDHPDETSAPTLISAGQEALNFGIPV